MNKHNILFIGLDTNKEFVEVAYIEDQRGAQAVHFGRISSAKTAIVKLAKLVRPENPNHFLGC